MTRRDRFDVSDVLIGLALTLATIGVLTLLTLAVVLACLGSVAL